MVLDLPLYVVSLEKLKQVLRNGRCQAEGSRIIRFLVEATVDTMDPFLVLIVVIVIGIILISRSSEEWFFFDLFSGNLFDSDYSTKQTNFEFNGFFYVLLTAVVLAGGCLVFSSFADDQPKRVFIPIENRNSTVASAHAHEKTTTPHHSASSHRAKTTTAPKTLPHLAKVQSKQN